MHILMADDDKDDYIILQESAAKMEPSILVTYAANWMDLWRLLMKGKPDVVFLDLNMPVKDGFECLATIRAEQRFENLPIIIYSTSTSKSDIEKAYTLGANYFIIKPNSLEELDSLLFKISSMSPETLAEKPEREEFVIL